MLNSFARTPPIVWKIGWVPTPTGELATKLPPLPIDLMHDKEVLKEYIFRINSIGKFVRSSFLVFSKFCGRIVLYCIYIKGNGYTFKGGNCQNWFYLSCEKGYSSKGKNLLPLGGKNFSPRSKFFPSRVDPFSEGTCAREQTGSHKNCLLCTN